MEIELDEVLIELFQVLEDKCVTISFQDGDQQNMRIISITHLKIDGTIIGDPMDGSEVEADANKPAIQFHISDVTEVREFESGIALYHRK